MKMKIHLIISVLVIFLAITVAPATGQGDGFAIADSQARRRDEAAIRDLLQKYENSFNVRDIEWRMALCLNTYYEYGFEDGQFIQARDYGQTKRETGRFWASIASLDYSIDEVDITLDGPQAFVRAYTTHLAPNDRHSSIVHFTLVKIDGVWRIAWDSYNIVRRY